MTSGDLYISIAISINVLFILMNCSIYEIKWNEMNWIEIKTAKILYSVSSHRLSLLREKGRILQWSICVRRRIRITICLSLSLYSYTCLIFILLDAMPTTWATGSLSADESAIAEASWPMLAERLAEILADRSPRLDRRSADICPRWEESSIRATGSWWW